MQAAAGAELHHQAKATLVSEMVIEPDNIRMVEAGEHLHLPQEIAMVARTWPQQDLNRHLPIGDRLVVGEEYLAEASISKPALDQIVPKPIADRNHRHLVTIDWQHSLDPVDAFQGVIAIDLFLGLTKKPALLGLWLSNL